MALGVLVVALDLLEVVVAPVAMVAFWLNHQYLLLPVAVVGRQERR